MDRITASRLTRAELDAQGLKDWGVRLTAELERNPFLGMCSHKDKVIILNAHHIDMHPDAEIICTIKHEVAHALTPGHGHDEVWADKAKSIGCDNTLPCSHLSLPDHVIDAIRSGQMIEVTTEEEHHVIRRPKFTITRLQDKCPDCGKVAEELFSIQSIDNDGNDIKLITLKCYHIIKKIIPRGTPFDLLVSNDWQDMVKNCKHEWDPEDPKRCMKCSNTRLMPFQVEDVRKAEAGLATRKGFGFFHDMGLGKTPMTMALIKFHSEYTPTLFVVKSSLTFQFMKQIINWIGPSHLPQIIRTSRDYIMPGLKCYIISFDLLKRFPREKLEKIGLKLVVIDECQQIKNPDSSRTQEVRKLVGNPLIKVLAASATPWKNRGSEFFPILNILDPLRFPSFKGFCRSHVAYITDPFSGKVKEGGIRNPAKFQELISDIMVRREYEQTIKDAPKNNKMLMNFQLDDMAQVTYNEAESDFVAWYNEAVINGEEDSINSTELLGRMARMRHLLGLATIPATIGLVEEFYENTDRKLMIFTQHDDVRELIVAELQRKFPDVPVFHFHSALKDGERYDLSIKFNQTPRAFGVASTLAYGEGVDWQTCADSIMHERQWNPQNEDQASPGRFRRIGQTANVINTTFMNGDGTISDHIAGIVERKRVQFHNAMNKTELPPWNETDFAKELASLIVSKHNARNKGGRVGGGVASMVKF